MTERFTLSAERNADINACNNPTIFVPPSVPDSSQAARNVMNPPWMTNGEAVKSIRSSVDSEPRYREDNSWVSHQAVRNERLRNMAKLSLAQKPAETVSGSVPSTPAAFRHHPGAPVTFIAKHKRLESSDLDRQLMG